MSNMANKVQGMGLALITKIASSEMIDQLNLRTLIEKTLYQGSKTGFKTLAKSQVLLKKSNTATKDFDQQRLTNQKKNLFDLSLSEEQQMSCDAMQQFATEVLRPLAHDADHQAQFPTALWSHVSDLGLNFFALPEALGGVATEKNIVSNILIASELARGDFSLAAGILTRFSVINAITQWGNQKVQAEYLSLFADDDKLHASFAFQEATAAFNPYQLKTQATEKQGQFFINGEKTLVLLGEIADFYLVSAEFQGQSDVFIVNRDESIAIKASPAMGLKATETVTLIFHNSPAQRLGDQDFNYHAFLNLGNLMWCALALGCCEAVKHYCIDYANERTAFGEPISHRQSVAFMIADMAIEIESMRMLILNAASLAESGAAFQREVYLARLLCAEKSMKIGTDGVQLLGGHGYTKEHPVERWYRDLRSMAILHGGLHA